MGDVDFARRGLDVRWVCVAERLQQHLQEERSSQPRRDFEADSYTQRAGVALSEYFKERTTGASSSEQAVSGAVSIWMATS